MPREEAKGRWSYRQGGREEGVSRTSPTWGLAQGVKWARASNSEERRSKAGTGRDTSEVYTEMIQFS